MSRVADLQETILALILFDKCALLVFKYPNITLFLFIKQHQYYALLKLHTSRYFMFLDQVSLIMQICWYTVLAW